MAPTVAVRAPSTKEKIGSSVYFGTEFRYRWTIENYVHARPVVEGAVIGIRSDPFTDRNNRQWQLMLKTRSDQKIEVTLLYQRNGATVDAMLEIEIEVDWKHRYQFSRMIRGNHHSPVLFRFSNYKTVDQVFDLVSNNIPAECITGMRVFCSIRTCDPPIDEAPIVLPPPPKTALNQDFRQLFVDGGETDINLISVEDKVIPAHKLILCARSPVFRAMFGTNMVEAKNNTVQMSTFSEVIVKGFVEFLYTGYTEISKDLALEFLGIAHMYQVEGLSDLAERIAAVNLTVDTAIHTYEMSLLYQATLLIGKSVQFIKKNKSVIAKTCESDLKEFARNNPEAILELFLAS